MDEAVAKDPVEALVLDLLEWIGPRARSYGEVLDAWRTSCPRLPVWEEANARSYLEPFSEAGQAMVRLTAAGREALNRRGARPEAAPR